MKTPFMFVIPLALSVVASVVAFSPAISEAGTSANGKCVRTPKGIVEACDHAFEKEFNRNPEQTELLRDSCVEGAVSVKVVSQCLKKFPLHSTKDEQATYDRASCISDLSVDESRTLLRCPMPGGVPARAEKKSVKVGYCNSQDSMDGTFICKIPQVKENESLKQIDSTSAPGFCQRIGMRFIRKETRTIWLPWMEPSYIVALDGAGNISGPGSSNGLRGYGGCESCHETAYEVVSEVHCQ